MNKFIWYGKNKHFDLIEHSHAMTTDDLLRGSFPSWFSLDNRRPHNNCEFLAECFFTGFKDSKGKEIFDGDILQTKNNIVEVFFGKKIHSVFMLGKKDTIEINGWLVRNAKGHTDVLDESFLQGKVIGNVYQNPELLV
jgi:YopX protein